VLGTATKLTANVIDPTSGVARVEWFVGTDPGLGLATPATVSAGTISVTLGATLSVGSYTIAVRALDVAGNWSPVTTTSLTVVPIGLSVSASANRSSPTDLTGTSVSGNVAVFATPAANASRVVAVTFYIDDANRTSLPYWLQLLTPYDLNGTASNGSANLFDSRLLPNGAHTLTVEVLRLNGTLERRTVAFNVNNAAPTVAQKLQVSTSPTRSNPLDLNGRKLSGSVAIFVTPTASVKSVEFWLDKPFPIPLSVDSSAPFDFIRTAGNGQATMFNVDILAPGTHRVFVRITFTNGTTAVVSATFTR
jgi:hypothetical protein